jgi:hypothetical protein
MDAQELAAAVTACGRDVMAKMMPAIHYGDVTGSFEQPTEDADVCVDPFEPHWEKKFALCADPSVPDDAIHPDVQADLDELGRAVAAEHDADAGLKASLDDWLAKALMGVPRIGLKGLMLAAVRQNCIGFNVNRLDNPFPLGDLSDGPYYDEILEALCRATCPPDREIDVELALGRRLHMFVQHDTVFVVPSQSVLTAWKPRAGGPQKNMMCVRPMVPLW